MLKNFSIKISYYKKFTVKNLLPMKMSIGHLSGGSNYDHHLKCHKEWHNNRGQSSRNSWQGHGLLLGPFNVHGLSWQIAGLQFQSKSIIRLDY